MSSVITFDLRAVAAYQDPAVLPTGWIKAQPLERTATDTLVLIGTEYNVRITAGVSVADLVLPTEVTTYYQMWPSFPGTSQVEPDTFLIPDGSTLTYGELLLNHRIDPTTLDPAAPLDPAWLAGLAAETAARTAADGVLTTAVGGKAEADHVTLDIREFGVVGTADDTDVLVDALAEGVPIRIPPNTIVTVTEPILVGSDCSLVGSGRASRIVSTHDGAVFASVTPGVRTYRWDMTGIQVNGPGKAVAGSVGFELNDVSTSAFNRVVITGFEKGVAITSSTSGFAVYNRFHDTHVSACVRGWSVEGLGCNATTWYSCRAFGANDFGVFVEDSNQCVWIAGEIEGNTVGFHVNATSAALADQNLIMGARFEGNTTAWAVAHANVRDFTVRDPRVFGAYTISDAGTRTQHTGLSGFTTNESQSQISPADGSWRFRRSSSGGASLPAFVVEDTASSAGTPVQYEARSARPGKFFRGLLAGVEKFAIGTDGSLSVDGVAKVYADVQVFLADGTWTKPPGAVNVHVMVIAGGGGGGSARRGAAATARAGGGGASGGGVSEFTLPASMFGATEPVVVGAGGVGGAARTTDSTSGLVGTAGGASSFASPHVVAVGGSPGAGGTAATGGAGTAAIGRYPSGAGGAANITSGLGANGAAGAGATPGGGAGGSLTAADVVGAGGTGWYGPGRLTSLGTGGTGSGGAGGAGASAPAGAPQAGSGGGGGAASATTAGGTGGAGGSYGAGGGGGGASLNGFDSGAGGAGGPGIVVVTAHF